MLAPASALGAVIREIRKRLGLTTAAFAKLLGVKQSSVSRYEAGERVPRPSVVDAIFAVADDDEKRKVIGALQEAAFLMFSPDLTPVEAMATLLITSGVEDVAGALMDRLGKRRQDPGFRRFVVAVAEVMTKCETVDDSIAEILQLWAAHSGINPMTAEYVRDALGSLRTRLWADRKKQVEQ